MAKMTFGIIVGNRGFFPDELALQGRREILEVLKKGGYRAVSLSLKDSKYGAVETLADAGKCAKLFSSQREKIQGVIITLPNFGDEKGVAEALKLSGLDVPVLVQAEPDASGRMSVKHRRDSFCGKISVCNNLRQAGIPFTLTRSHCLAVRSKEFAHELDEFAAVCRIVKGLKNVRLGAVGARPGAFNTVRFSEKILEHYGISVEPVDLSEILGRVSYLSDKDRGVQAKLRALKNYTVTEHIPPKSLLKMAKFGYVIDRWCQETGVAGTAIQCWTSLETFFGISPCTLMSMMSETLRPSACEVDLTGLLSMYILQLAGQSPSALVDWNNNYASSPDKCVVFHCSNLPKTFFESSRMEYQQILAGSMGQDNTYGTITGRIAPNPATFLRVTTDDTEGMVSAYTGHGEFTSDKLQTFGGYGVFRVPDLQQLMQYVCRGGFEHHVALNISQRANAVAEALSVYLGWDVYRHM
jgi:L-fucose isomerase-like protein